jgi:hypothetical protein
MGISKLTAIRIILVIICSTLLLSGLAYIWHYVPASDWLGVTPPDNMATEEGWYAFNEITGWALVFAASTTLFYLLFAGLKIKSAGKLLGSTLLALAISLVLAAFGAELITNIIN